MNICFIIPLRSPTFLLSSLHMLSITSWSNFFNFMVWEFGAVFLSCQFSREPSPSLPPLVTTWSCVWLIAIVIFSHSVHNAVVAKVTRSTARVRVRKQSAVSFHSFAAHANIDWSARCHSSGEGTIKPRYIHYIHYECWKAILNCYYSKL